MRILSFVAAAVLISVSAHAVPVDPSIVVHLLDYLAKDYSGAVRDGKVISESEYGEQKEFASIVSIQVENIESLNRNESFVKVS